MHLPALPSQALDPLNCRRSAGRRQRSLARRVNRRIPFCVATLALAALAGGTGPVAGMAAEAGAATVGPEMGGGLLAFLRVAAPAGREQAAVAFLRSVLGPGLPARTDALGTLTVALGSGEPRRLVVCPLGEPALVVEGIDPNGYLRLGAASPAAPAGALWEQAHEGQLVWVAGARREVPGAVAPRSIHLQGATARGRPPFALADAYVDVGAENAAEVARLGIRRLDPVVLDRRPVRLAHGLIAGPAARQKGACLAAAAAARRFRPRPGGGTVVFAWTAREGGATASPPRQGGASAKVVEIVDLGRPWPPATGLPERPPPPAPGAGLLIAGALAGGSAARPPAAPHAALSWSARRTPESPRIGYLGLPALFPGTPVETISLADVENLENTLLALLASPGSVASRTPSPDDAGRGVPPPPAKHAAPADDPVEAAIAALTASLVARVGVSGGEGAIRDAIRGQLPPWAHPVVDRLGNLAVSFGGPPIPAAKGPTAAAGAAPRLFMAHMDEVGFRVSAVLPDGRLTLHAQGGAYSYLWEAQAAVVQGLHGAVPAIFEPRADWRTAKSAELPGELTAWTGAASAREVAALGIATGSVVSMPKQMLRLGRRRIVGHSLDDRLGDAVLLLALRRLDPAKVRHRILFAWTVREETGPTGAVYLANQQKAVESVYPVDAFISSDSPRESRPIGRVPLGGGAVLRTGNGSAAPREVIDRVTALARRLAIPLTTGISVGGTDGLPFVYRGGTVLPLGWPGRYSHTPVEVADLRDVEALVRLVVALASEP
jgi:putative aminopeptidase